MRLVVSGRADPPLPLSCGLARGRLNRVQAGELRFTPDEAVLRKRNWRPALGKRPDVVELPDLLEFTGILKG